MYDKSDPRSALAQAPGAAPSGTTAMPASYGLYYRDPPVDDDANGRGWYIRGQVDEYMILLPDDATAYEATAGAQSVSGNGFQLLIVPPGDSRICLPGGGQVVRLFSTQSSDLNAFTTCVGRGVRTSMNGVRMSMPWWRRRPRR